MVLYDNISLVSKYVQRFGWENYSNECLVVSNTNKIL
jgi:hypothetical protein